VEGDEKDSGGRRCVWWRPVGCGGGCCQLKMRGNLGRSALWGWSSVSVGGGWSVGAVSGWRSRGGRSGGPIWVRGGCCSAVAVVEGNGCDGE